MLKKLERLVSKPKVDTTFWLFIFPTGTILRLLRLGHFSLWYDECASIQLSKLVNLKFEFLSPLLNNEPPINALFTFLWLKFLETIRFWEKYTVYDDFAIRVLPCLWSILSIPVFYKVVKKIFHSHPTAILTTTFLFAISPIQVYYAQELRIYSFYVLMNLIGLLFLLRILENNLWKDWIGLGLTFVILMYSHYFSVWTIFTTNLFLLIIIPFKKELFRKWFWTNLIAGLFILPALYLAWFFHEIVSNIKYVWYPNPTIKTAFITWKNLFAGYTDRVNVYWIVFLTSIGLFIYGTIKLHKQKEIALYIILMSFFPIFCNVFFWGLRHFSFYEHRLFIFSGVVGIIAVGNGLANITPPKLKLLCIFIFTFLTSICLYDYYTGRLHPVDAHRLGVYNKVDFRNLSHYIRSNFQKEDLVAYASHFMVPSLKHYLDGYPNFRVGMSAIDVQVHIDTFGNPTLLEHHGMLPIPIAQATKNKNRLWFIETTGITFEYKPHTIPIKEWLNNHGEILDMKEFYGLSLTLYKLKPANETKHDEPSN